jgi:hypothetical protein
MADLTGSGWKISQSLQIHGAQRDIVATDGMKITLGETPLPSGSPPAIRRGTMSYTFTVLDRGKPSNVAYSGAPPSISSTTRRTRIKNFQTYIDLQNTMAAKAAATGATVLLSNHSDSTMRSTKTACSLVAATVPILRARRRLGPALFPVMQGCARARS